jgi:HK97 gp10 family phage protein
VAGSVQITGLRELEQDIERFSTAVTDAFKATAFASAERIAANAKAMLRSKTHGTGRTANAIRVLDESRDKQYVVNSPGDPEQWSNLPDALEFGTRFMAARPYMRPAGDSESPRYKAAMTATAEQTATKVLG